MNQKPWYQSLTLWWNVGTLIVALASIFADPALVSDPRIVAAAATVVTVGNALLRALKTSQPLAFGTAVPAAGGVVVAPAPVPPS